MSNTQRSRRGLQPPTAVSIDQRRKPLINSYIRSTLAVVNVGFKTFFGGVFLGDSRPQGEART
jgi:hypothetical protein